MCTIDSRTSVGYRLRRYRKNERLLAVLGGSRCPSRAKVCSAGNCASIGIGHKEQSSMIRRYIIWRNEGAAEEKPCEIVNKEALSEAALPAPFCPLPAAFRGLHGGP